MSAVATLPARRPQLTVRPLGEQGQHVVKDPFNGSYFQLGPEETFLLLKLDGTSTRADVRQAFEKKFEQSLEEEELDDFLELARSSHFVETQAGAVQPTDERPKGVPREQSI